MPAIIPAIENPYVGPRTFERAQGHLFFGREAEARDLLSRVVSERLLLFYAQSGAGKSSLINARLIPALQEAGFAALPVGRVSGDLPPGVVDVPNIFLFNLKVSLDEGETAPNLLAAVSLTDFLARLASEDGVRWAYDPQLPGAQPPAVGAAGASGQQPFVLIIDQFEEIISTQAGRWQERAGFFTALNEALLADPNLWVVLTLREDYVAALDPYAPLLFNRLRARFYMERMGVAAALDAVSKPAALAGRAFDPGVAEQLVDNLRQVRIPGQEQPQPGQYVEPVQLQVVCYQLWENIKRRPLGPITAADLQEAGDVDRALVQFYEETLTAVLADPAAQGLNERQLRTWFSSELITESETRGLVHQGKRETGSLPNPVVRKLQGRFLVRVETRAGGAWVELVHDRFVEPILESNRAWFVRNQSPITQAALAWDAAGQPISMLLSEEPLADAQAQLAAQPAAYTELERTFVNQSQLAAAKARARRQGRMITLLLAAAVVIGIGAVGAVVMAIRANASEAAAVASAALAEVAAANAVNARATANAERVVAIEAQGTAEALAILASDQAERLQEQVATAEAALTAQVALAESLSALLTLAAPTFTPTPEPTPLTTPTPPLTPTPVRPVVVDDPTPTASVLLPTPTPTPVEIVQADAPTATPDLAATAAARAVLDTAQNALDQFGALPTPTPAGFAAPPLLPLPTELQLFEPLPQFQQTGELPPSRNADPALVVGANAALLPGLNSVLRSEPGFGSGEIIGYVTDSDTVLITGGPIAVAGDADTIVWWFVELADGTRGWTPANTSQFTLLAPAAEQSQ